VLGLIGVAALLIVLGISLLITRVAATALSMTGLSHQAARFQARSAFTGTGFTTGEAESVVEHPVRRRVIMWLMIVRSAGLISIILSLILSFVGSGGTSDRLDRLLWMIAGVVLLWSLANSKWLDRYLQRWVRRALTRWTDLDTRDYEELLALSSGYTVTEFAVEEDSWVAGRTLDDCQLAEEGILVLGVQRNDGRYVGAPRRDTKINGGNVLILYGREEQLEDLQERRSGAEGEQSHRRAVGEQQRQQAEEHRRDVESEES
jgi:K+/H+ antiporter YhaU regulatory subunit KhtT